MTAPDDPVLVRRARIARLVQVGQRVGYGLFGLAIVVFLWGYFAGYTDTLTTIIVAALIIGSIILAPAIVFGYAVKAAVRDDREHGRIPPEQQGRIPPEQQGRIPPEQ